MNIYEIANIAEVSTATVSRYINGNSKVSAQAAEKIQQSMDRLGYKPKIRRPGRKTRDRVGIKTGIILFLSIGKIESSKMISYLSAYSLLVIGLQKALFEQNMSIVFAHTNGNDNDVPEMLDRKFCDGVVVFARDFLLGKRIHAKLLSLPTVWCGGSSFDTNLTDFDQVIYKNANVGRIAAEYLESKQHKKVVVFQPQRNNAVFCERTASFKEYCHEHGIDVDVILCFDDASVALSKIAQEAADIFIRNHQNATGAFFQSDNFMLSVCTKLQLGGFDLSKLEIVGCNNERKFLEHFDVIPASVDICLEKLGVVSAQRILERIRSENQLKVEIIEMAPEIVK